MPRAADDFATIKARTDELARERALAEEEAAKVEQERARAEQAAAAAQVPAEAEKDKAPPSGWAAVTSFRLIPFEQLDGSVHYWFWDALQPQPPRWKGPYHKKTEARDAALRIHAIRGEDLPLIMRGTA